MGKNAWSFTVMAVFMVASVVAQAPAPAPSADCTSAITTLAPCLSFVMTPTNQTKPDKDCCTALSTIVSTKVVCLCPLLDPSASMGLPINRTQALALPGACNVKTPPVSKCAAALGNGPTASPGTSPTISPVSSEPAKSPTMSPSAATAPAPSPVNAPKASSPAPSEAASSPSVSPAISPASSPSGEAPSPISSPPTATATATPPGASPTTSSATPPGGSSTPNPGPAVAPEGANSSTGAIFTPSAIVVLAGLALATLQL